MTSPLNGTKLVPFNPGSPKQKELAKQKPEKLGFFAKIKDEMSGGEESSKIKDKNEVIQEARDMQKNPEKYKGRDKQISTDYYS